MDPNEILRIVDAIHRDKNIDKEIVFEGYRGGADFGRQETLRRRSRGHCRDRSDHRLDPRQPQRRADGDGRDRRAIGAQTAKQVMIQKIREAERDALFAEYEELRGQLVTGVVQRYEGAPPPSR